MKPPCLPEWSDFPTPYLHISRAEKEASVNGVLYLEQMFLGLVLRIPQEP
jgi:hypothetical protein